MLLVMAKGWQKVPLLLLLLAIISPARRPQAVKTETIEPKATDEQESTRKLMPMLVDTKYWTGNTQFGDRENWLNGLKPCTLLERISLNEESVVSLGDSLDSLGGSLGESSNIRDFSLALNGLLLLEEDTLDDDPLDPLFIQFLNQSGDCVEGDTLNPLAGEGTFVFQPEADQLSWFNPNNWRSNLNEIVINDWIPESHAVPCGEDLVVFGSRQLSLEPTIEANERASTLSFKVNFKASEFVDKQTRDNLNGVRVNNLRVSRVKIGDQFYNQLEFNRLIQSDQYRNILFDFNNSLNVLKPDNTDYDYNLLSQQPLLTIDESSFQIDSSGLPVCLDEAGCLCGNEDENIMKTICSFNLPLESRDQPCHDPISSTGYCNKVCATVVVITMDPMKFSEPLVISLINKIINDEEDKPSSEIFAGARRTYDNKYEITFRLIPDRLKGLNRANLGRERKLAELISNHLNSPATKSFYGIKSIIIKSSNQWKSDNRGIIFWSSLSFLLPITLAIFVYRECSNVRLDPEPVNLSFTRVWSLLSSYLQIFTQFHTDETTESFISYDQTNIDHSHSGQSSPNVQKSSTEIPLVKFDNTDLLSMKEID